MRRLCRPLLSHILRASSVSSVSNTNQRTRDRSDRTNSCPSFSQTASPQLSQTLYIAGLAFIAEMKHASLGLSGVNSASASRPPSPSSKQEENSGSSSTTATAPTTSHTPGAPLQASDQFLNLLAQQNLNVIIKALRQMTHYWAGAGVMLNILTQRSQGQSLLSLPKTSLHSRIQTLTRLPFRFLSGMTHSKIDFSATSDNIKTFVSLPDSGVLRRFTSDLAPPGSSSPPPPPPLLHCPLALYGFR